MGKLTKSQMVEAKTMLIEKLFGSPRRKHEDAMLSEVARESLISQYGSVGLIPFDVLSKSFMFYSDRWQAENQVDDPYEDDVPFDYTEYDG